MKPLIDELTAFADDYDLSEHRVGIILASNGRLIPRLRENRRIWPDTEARIRANIAKERATRPLPETRGNKRRCVQGGKA